MSRKTTHRSCSTRTNCMLRPISHLKVTNAEGIGLVIATRCSSTINRSSSRSLQIGEVREGTDRDQMMARCEREHIRIK